MTVSDFLQTKLTREPSIYDSDSVNPMLETEFLEHTNHGCINENKSRIEVEVVIVNFEDMFSDSIITDKQLKGK